MHQLSTIAPIYLCSSTRCNENIYNLKCVTGLSTFTVGPRALCIRWARMAEDTIIVNITSLDVLYNNLFSCFPPGFEHYGKTKKLHKGALTYVKTILRPRSF